VKKQLAVLDGPFGPMTTTQRCWMLPVIFHFYRKLFGFEARPNMCLGADFWDEGDLVNNEENSNLEKPFPEEEVKAAIFGSYANGAPGSDGMSFLFYLAFWETIKNDFMALVDDFWSGTLDAYKLNFSIITLIPKELDARDM
jgi:hypothetical protein